MAAAKAVCVSPYVANGDVSKRLIFLKHYEFEGRHCKIQCISCITLNPDKFFFVVSIRTLM